jgi:hypothetical protein
MPAARPATPRETLTLVASAACLASPVAGAKFLAQSRDVTTTCESACIAARDLATCVRGWTVYSAGATFDHGNECTTAETPAGLTVEARLCCCLSTMGPAPLLDDNGAPYITH